VNFFTGVPDSCIATFCAELDEPSPGLRHVVASNEGAAVGTAMGHHLATGGVPCVYLQVRREERSALDQTARYRPVRCSQSC